MRRLINYLSGFAGGTSRPGGLSRRSLVALAFLLGIAWASRAPAAWSEKTASLHYHWKTGQTYAYAVTVEVDQGDYFDILSGTPTYTVTKADQDGIVLSFRGRLAAKQQAKPGKQVPFRANRFAGFSPFTGVGSGGIERPSQLTINDRGEVLSSQGSSQLPYLLGNLSQLVLLPLPKEGERTWKENQELAISLLEGRFPIMPLMREDDSKKLKAVQDTEYKVEQQTEETAVVGEKTNLQTGETVGGKPRFEMTGQGKLTLDLRAGVPAKLEYQETLTVREGNTTEETPIRVTARLLDESERAKVAASVEGAALFPNEGLSEAALSQALADLKSKEQARTIKAMFLLQGKDPAKPNPAIAAALQAFLTDKDPVMRFTASKALIKWATPETVPALIKALNDESVIVRINAMTALGRLKADAAAEPIARKLASTQDRFQASQALQDMGPAAEPAILKMIGDKDWAVRSEVCKILKVVGTQKSVPALEGLRDDPNPLVKVMAQQALEAITARK